MNILLTSVGRRTYMVEYFKQALQKKGLVHAANSLYTYALTRADKYIVTPQIYDDGYILFLLDYCRREKISAIISLFDIDLPILAKNIELFAQNNINILVSDHNVTQICNDKWKTYQFLTEIGLPQPNTYISLKELKDSINTGKVRFPIVLKPRWGMGSIGICKVYNEEELNVYYRSLKRDIFCTYLKYESSADMESCIIAQQFLSGQEYGVEIINDLECNYVTTFAKKKLAMRAGETDIAEIVDSSEFVKIAEVISKSLRHKAVLDVDCFKNDKGEIMVLEMNCRFGGQYPFSHNAGANVPLQIIKWLDGEPSDRNLLSPKVGVRSCKDIVPVVF